MKATVYFLLSACCLISNSYSQRPVRPQVYALVVGVAKYSDANIPELKYADKDATAFATFLKSAKAGAVPDENLVLLTNTDATSRTIMRHLNRLLNDATKEDLFIFYFSGHGTNSKMDKRGYLLTYDTEKDNEAGSALPMADLNSRIEQCGAKMRLSYIDACHAGLFKSRGKGLENNVALVEQFRNSISGNWEGFASFLACSPTQESLEDDHLKAGVFTYYLLSGLQGAADSLLPEVKGYQDGIVTISEMENYLTDKVRKATGATQKPILEGDLYDSDFPLSIVGAAKTLSAAIAGRPKARKDTVPEIIAPPVLPRFKVIKGTLNVLAETSFATEIQTGDSLVIRSSGQVNLGQMTGDVGPSGNANPFLNIYSYFPQLPHGALLVKVGTGSYSLCNELKTAVSLRTGKLTFLINDKDYSNNSGNFQVAIEIYRRIK